MNSLPHREVADAHRDYLRHLEPSVFSPQSSDTERGLEILRRCGFKSREDVVDTLWKIELAAKRARGDAEARRGQSTAKNAENTKT